MKHGRICIALSKRNPYTAMFDHISFPKLSIQFALHSMCEKLFPCTWCEIFPVLYHPSTTVSYLNRKWNVFTMGRRPRFQWFQNICFETRTERRFLKSLYCNTFDANWKQTFMFFVFIFSMNLNLTGYFLYNIRPGQIPDATLNHIVSVLFRTFFALSSMNFYDKASNLS